MLCGQPAKETHMNKQTKKIIWRLELCQKQTNKSKQHIEKQQRSTQLPIQMLV
jgi:hypothetical protein